MNLYLPLSSKAKNHCIFNHLSTFEDLVLQAMKLNLLHPDHAVEERFGCSREKGKYSKSAPTHKNSISDLHLITVLSV